MLAGIHRQNLHTNICVFVAQVRHQNACSVSPVTTAKRSLLKPHKVDMLVFLAKKL